MDYFSNRIPYRKMGKSFEVSIMRNKPSMEVNLKYGDVAEWFKAALC